MAFLSTGLIKNSEATGIRPSSTLSVRISNPDSVSANIRINGFYWTETAKTEYVFDLFSLAPGEVSSSNYYAKFDAYEFQFVTSSDAVEISAWGENTAGNLTVVHSLKPSELFPIGTPGIEGAPGRMPSELKRIYVPNTSGNTVSVVDENSNTVINTVSVGTCPVCVGINPETNRIYVSNRSSHTVSVIDGLTDVVIATIIVGASPEGVKVDPITNRIYIHNNGSHNVSVINGTTNTVIATIENES